MGSAWLFSFSNLDYSGDAIKGVHDRDRVITMDSQCSPPVVGIGPARRKRAGPLLSNRRDPEKVSPRADGERATKVLSGPHSRVLSARNCRWRHPNEGLVKTDLGRSRTFDRTTADAGSSRSTLRHAYVRFDLRTGPSSEGAGLRPRRGTGPAAALVDGSEPST